MQAVQGIHHITAVAGDPQANINFYHHILGQRLVKKTVNFDDPGTYHFYFADEIGTPGTVLTFFPWRHMSKGQRGNGEVAATAYSIHPDSLPYWQERLAEHGIIAGEIQTRFGAQVLPFPDPDGMIIELVTNKGQATFSHWQAGPVPAEHALRGFFGATLWVANAEGTAALLRDSLGFTFAGQEGSRSRFQAAYQDIGMTIDLLERPGLPPGRFGAGSVHHIAFRTVDDTEQGEYLNTLRQDGYQVSPVMDRQYFHSIYFRSPGGILFEIATDAPGFLYDEPVTKLGTHLKLPPWLESQRSAIEGRLPVVTLDPEPAGPAL